MPDLYGGYTEFPAPGGATGFFRLARIGQRWSLVSPLGNAFFLNSVALTNSSSLANNVVGTTPAGQPPRKYPNNAAWAAAQIPRLRSWGFNATGAYSLSYVFPEGQWGNPGNPDPMPFLWIFSPGVAARPPKPGGAMGGGFQMKDIVAGLDLAQYKNGWRGRGADFMDPGWLTWVPQFIAYSVNSFDHAAVPASGGKPAVPARRLKDSPWLVAAYTDDADFWRGTKRADAAHPGWLCLVTSPTQTGDAKSLAAFGVASYSDPVVHSKKAVCDFLETRYGTIAALNAAWGSNYTTFGSDGGWKVGTGLLDENGRNPWVHIADFSKADTVDLQLLPAPVKQDLDDFMVLYVERGVGTLEAAIRVALPNHLLFGLDAIRFRTRPKVNAVLAAHCDALMCYCLPDPVPASLRELYNQTHKPLAFWMGMTAQEDSMFKGVFTDAYNLPTQVLRGEAFARVLAELVEVQGDDGIFPVLGPEFWALYDSGGADPAVLGGEKTNWGLADKHDAEYAEFTSRVTAAHGALPEMLRASLTGVTPPTTTPLRDALDAAADAIALAKTLAG